MQLSIFFAVSIHFALSLPSNVEAVRVMLIVCLYQPRSAEGIGLDAESLPVKLDSRHGIISAHAGCLPCKVVMT